MSDPQACSPRAGNTDPWPYSPVSDSNRPSPTEPNRPLNPSCVDYNVCREPVEMLNEPKWEAQAATTDDDRLAVRIINEQTPIPLVFPSSSHFIRSSLTSDMSLLSGPIAQPYLSSLPSASYTPGHDMTSALGLMVPAPTQQPRQASNTLWSQSDSFPYLTLTSNDPIVLHNLDPYVFDTSHHGSHEMKPTLQPGLFDRMLESQRQAKKSSQSSSTQSPPNNPEPTINYPSMVHGGGGFGMPINTSPPVSQPPARSPLRVNLPDGFDSTQRGSGSGSGKGKEMKQRTRIPEACVGCRKRKCKCQGGNPCTRCQLKNIPCVFDRRAGSTLHSSSISPSSSNKQYRDVHSPSSPLGQSYSGPSMFDSWISSDPSASNVDSPTGSNSGSEVSGEVNQNRNEDPLISFGNHIPNPMTYWNQPSSSTSNTNANTTNTNPNLNPNPQLFSFESFSQYFGPGGPGYTGQSTGMGMGIGSSSTTNTNPNTSLSPSNTNTSSFPSPNMTPWGAIPYQSFPQYMNPSQLPLTPYTPFSNFNPSPLPSTSTFPQHPAFASTSTCQPPNFASSSSSLSNQPSPQSFLQHQMYQSIPNPYTSTSFNQPQAESSNTDVSQMYGGNWVSPNRQEDKKETKPLYQDWKDYAVPVSKRPWS
ncbi:hypothetical protein TREMEDRAFT_62270 [Tremella mesenterica DSM 1558]|uniref:uncharacterized protein n=1 Tax=Tremella mesenterica (strain ATCC 24925 / CBS 8224 / DSM 1558 / NBRC 9311 / NRRL Y-6157 / RJB 2259-6 / UBC 559-6) TaxID=578456 RepID=UPI0003F49A50|nr:uncharacterized protein TREMEDRAFT_62270 [Tremella mesenterica DSM 1558]EIW69405.1 hypothetical protein TREMEDRAFT_62270 [Tremella mesenterica DSM 1558]